MMVLLLFSAAIAAPGWMDLVPITGQTFSTGYPVTSICTTEASGDINLHHVYWQPHGGSEYWYGIVDTDGSQVFPETPLYGQTDPSFDDEVTCCIAIDETRVLIAWTKESSLVLALEIRDHDGTILVPEWTLPPFASAVRWIEGACDGDGNAHLMVTRTGISQYVGVDTGTGAQMWRKSFQNRSQPDICVHGDRVHLTYVKQPYCELLYSQYDTSGNPILTEVQLTSSGIEASSPSICTDRYGNPFIADAEELNYYTFDLGLYKLDPATGTPAMPRVVIDQYVECIATYIHLMRSEAYPSLFRLVWVRDTGFMGPSMINSATVTETGVIAADPVAVYDPEWVFLDVDATLSSNGDICVTGSQRLPTYPDAWYWIDLGGYLGSFGIEPWSGREGIRTEITADRNPVRGYVTLTVIGDGCPGGLRIFDSSGRIVASLDSGDANSFVWDSSGPGGGAVPAGVYVVTGVEGDTEPLLLTVL